MPFCEEGWGSLPTTRAASLLLACNRLLQQQHLVLHPSRPTQDLQHSWWLHQDDHVCSDAKNLTLRSFQPSLLPPSHPYPVLDIYLELLPASAITISQLPLSFPTPHSTFSPQTPLKMCCCICFPAK